MSKPRNKQIHVFLFQKIPKTNPFDIVNAKVQRFYFNNSSGKILIGFYKPYAGFAGNQWVLTQVNLKIKEIATKITNCWEWSFRLKFDRSGYDSDDCNKSLFVRSRRYPSRWYDEVPDRLQVAECRSVHRTVEVWDSPGRMWRSGAHRYVEGCCTAGG